MTYMDTLVVVPTYNERENIERIIEAVAAQGCDVLVIDDGSPDGTGDLVIAKAPKVAGRVFLIRRHGKLGLGTAYADAFTWVLANQPSYKTIVQMDADFSHPPEALPYLIESANASGIAIGSRYVPGGQTPDWPWYRQMLSRVANFYARAIINMRFGHFHVHDATAGFVAWRRDVLAKTFAKPVISDGYAFQIEAKFRATRLGYKPVELPITFRDRTKGRSKISHGIIWETLLLPWRLR